jgi:hypothetical protein
MAEEIRQKRLEGKVLVEREDGNFEYRKLDDVKVDILVGKLVAEEVKEYYPNEDKVAQLCPTGEKR